MAKRVDKQPLDKPSAGSTFKRPAGAFAAALIDQCGLRGYPPRRRGRQREALRLRGEPGRRDLRRCAGTLCDEVRAIVKEKTGLRPGKRDPGRPITEKARKERKIR